MTGAYDERNATRPAQSNDDSAIAIQRKIRRRVTITRPIRFGSP
jgi:hypothetical protein